ncbi:hypothetical protein VTO42DRAFT_8905 [Malbranchea cinnamomea]
MAPDASGRRSSSSSAASSVSSTLPPLNIPKRSLYNLNAQGGSPTSPRIPSASANSSNVSLPNFSRPAGQLAPPSEIPPRKSSPLAMPSHDALKHRPRQHSQGFFEPTLPTATMSEQHHSRIQQNSAQLSASRIAAQTAMQHQTLAQQNLRSRSSTIPPQDNVGSGRKVSSPPPPPSSASLQPPSAPLGYRGVSIGGQGLNYQDGTVGGRAVAAATAANLAFPRNHAVAPTGSAVESHGKESKEKSKMKLFSKPKHMIISRDRSSDKQDKGLQSPSKPMLAGSSGLSRMVNASTTSLTETVSSNSTSMYSLSNSSVSTVVPTDRSTEKDKEKHKHHFLSRPKLKLKDRDKDDHHHYNLPLSSASSNSKPLDPSAPQSLYSFTPSSPSTTSFSKSVSGLDLRHGGRALREKKKEEKAEKAAAAAAAAAAARADENSRDGEQSIFGETDASALAASDMQMREVLQSFGLNNMAPEDAWDFLKAKLLVLFEGEDVRIALEDLNKLVSVHLRRCVQKKMPSIIIEDLRDLLQTGFASINHSLLSVPDDRLVPYLARTWLFVFGTVLPFIQAVFLPLDLEFKGRGSIMSAREAAEFWGAVPNGELSNATVGEKLDVRDIVLATFRDTIILNRYELLKNTFSQLSLDKININATTATLSTRRQSSSSGPSTIDPRCSSFNSQSSTALNTPGSLSSDTANNPLASHAQARARTTSNTSSNPDLPFLQSANSAYSSSFSPPQHSVLSQVGLAHIHPSHQQQGVPADPSLMITETVGRMFQCISVLASVATNDDAQEQIEELRKAIKLNWLGRARTGRDRRGFVGMKVRRTQPSRKFGEEWDGGGPSKVTVGGE